MKLILSCTVVLIVILIGISAQAQVPPLTLYDNFKSKYLNPDLWFGLGSGTTGLESATQIKTDPVSQNRSLSLFHRGYGNTDINSGRGLTRNRFFFSDGTGITTIQAKVQVKKVQAIGCPANPNPTDVQARMGGFFFNTGTPTPGDSTNDVGAFIVLRRRSNSTDASNVLEVVGYAIQCTIDDCSTSNPVGTEQSLGTARVGKRTTLRITWDPANDQFIFRKGNDPEVSLSYSPLSDTSDPGASNGGAKRLDVQEIVTNCIPVAGQPRPVGYMETWFDDVFTN